VCVCVCVCVCVSDRQSALRGHEHNSVKCKIRFAARKKHARERNRQRHSPHALKKDRQRTVWTDFEKESQGKETDSNSATKNHKDRRLAAPITLIAAQIEQAE
jgi:hypothetical protein